MDIGVKLINFDQNRKYYAQRRVQQIPFGAIKLYNDRPTVHKKLFLNTLLKLKNIKKCIKNFFTVKHCDKKDDISINNHFIAKIQSKISKAGVPAGTFNLKNGDVIEIKQFKDGHKKIDIFIGDDYDKHFPYRSAILDSDNKVLRYETSSPWKVFVKTEEGYRCYPNVDAYMKSFAGDPKYSFDLMPKL